MSGKIKFTCELRYGVWELGLGEKKKESEKERFVSGTEKKWAESS